MPWLKLDDDFIENEKIEKLRDRAFRIHVSALVYCSKNLTDGQITAKGGKVLSVLVGFKIDRHIPELVDAGLWRPDSQDDSHWINDYLKYNPDAASVRKLREDRSAAGRRGAAAKHGHRGGKSQWQVPDHLPQQPPDHLPYAPVVARPLPVLKAVTADEEIEHEVDKLLGKVYGCDDGTRGVLLSLAAKLPLSSVAKVRESCSSRNVSAGYAVRALQSELAEAEDVA